MFSQRSSKKELLDSDNIPEKDLYRNLDELDFINHWLGGYSVSFNALKKLNLKGSNWHLVDIGCGGGDTLKRIRNWARTENISLELTGIDLKETCIRYCNEKHRNSQIRLIEDDYRNILNHISKVDIIHACLFCHHLNENEIIDLLKFSTQTKAILVINDLHRNWLAWASIRLLTQLFSSSYLVKNDAPLSVLRGFSTRDWKEMMKKAGIKKAEIRWKWAFRHQIIVYGNA
jgi:2-polyprenyl-3-methyl-5-hydroxy-6-metoxy-1,4-benzoquinol methylase